MRPVLNQSRWQALKNNLSFSSVTHCGDASYIARKIWSSVRFQSMLGPNRRDLHIGIYLGASEPIHVAFKVIPGPPAARHCRPWNSCHLSSPSKESRRGNFLSAVIRRQVGSTLENRHSSHPGQSDSQRKIRHLVRVISDGLEQAKK